MNCPLFSGHLTRPSSARPSHVKQNVQLVCGVKISSDHRSQQVHLSSWLRGGEEVLLGRCVCLQKVAEEVTWKVPPQAALTTSLGQYFASQGHFGEVNGQEKETAGSWDAAREAFDQAVVGLHPYVDARLRCLG